MHAGRKHGVKVAPMAPLSAVVAAALSAEGVTAEASACHLLHGKTQLDLQTPLRFANFPAGAKLQLLTGMCASSPAYSPYLTGPTDASPICKVFLPVPPPPAPRHTHSHTTTTTTIHTPT